MQPGVEPVGLASVVLRDQWDADGSRRLGVEVRQDGRIVIEGQDLGPGVERIWGDGNDEYEWVWVIEPDAVPAMVAALGGVTGDDPARLLKVWYDEHGDMDPGIRLREAGVPVEFWSRVGDWRPAACDATVLRCPEPRAVSGCSLRADASHCADHVASLRLLRCQEEAVAALPEGSGPGALTARERRTTEPPGPEAPRGRGHH